MASQQVEKEISSETGSLLKLEDGNETNSISLSNESRAAVEDETWLKSASNTNETIMKESTSNADGIVSESASNRVGNGTENASNQVETGTESASNQIGTDTKTASSQGGTGTESTTNTGGTGTESTTNTGGTGTESTTNQGGTGTESASNQDGTGTESVSNSDLDDESSDENRERKRREMSNDPQLQEKRFIFLKKHFDELKTLKRIPNFYKRHGERTILKPLKFEDLPCVCQFESKFPIPENTNEDEEQLAREETTALSDVSTQSQIDPLEGHSKTCNVHRLNLYFRAITEYFSEEDSHPDLFLLDPNPPVDYKQKAMREIRKITVLHLNHGLEVTLEEWEDCMTDRDVKKWEKRNYIREYLHFILSNMLESLIGPNESLSECEENPDDSAPSSLRRSDQIDPDKLEYQRLRKLHGELEVMYKKALERSKFLIQEAVIEGYYPSVQKRMRKIRAAINSFLAFSPEVSSEESEKETE